jgi:hypothetical protein
VGYRIEGKQPKRKAGEVSEPEESASELPPLSDTEDDGHPIGLNPVMFNEAGESVGQAITLPLPSG